MKGHWSKRIHSKCPTCGGREKRAKIRGQVVRLCEKCGKVRPK